MQRISFISFFRLAAFVPLFALVFLNSSSSVIASSSDPTQRPLGVRCSPAQATANDIHTYPNGDARLEPTGVVPPGTTSLAWVSAVVGGDRDSSGGYGYQPYTFTYRDKNGSVLGTHTTSTQTDYAILVNYPSKQTYPWPVVTLTVTSGSQTVTVNCDNGTQDRINKPDLMPATPAGSENPYTANIHVQAGVPVTLRGFVASSHASSAGGTFDDVFMVDPTGSDHWTVRQNATPRLNAINHDDNSHYYELGWVSTTLPASTFTSSGVHEYQFCVDSDVNWVGHVAERDESDNCIGGDGNHFITVDAAPTPDLIASDITPSSVTVNTPMQLTSVISNAGGATPSGFTTLFQQTSSIDTNGQPTGSVNDIGTDAMDALGSSATANAQFTYTFGTVGTTYVRACADHSSGSDLGTVVESNETNNCGPWTRIGISDVTTGSCNVTTTAGTALTFNLKTSYVPQDSGMGGMFNINWGDGSPIANSGLVDFPDSYFHSFYPQAHYQQTHTWNTPGTYTVTGMSCLGYRAVIGVDGGTNPYSLGSSYTMREPLCCSGAAQTGGSLGYVEQCTAYGDTTTQTPPNIQAPGLPNSFNVNSGASSESTPLTTCTVTVTSTDTTPDLTASSVTSNSDGTMLSGTVTNIGSGTTGAGFPNVFQEVDSVDGSGNAVGTVTKLGTVSADELAGGASATITLNPTAPVTSRTWVRICADTDSSGNGAITESNENNNCGAWSQITTSTNSTNALTCTVDNDSPSISDHVQYSVTAKGIKTSGQAYIWSPSNPSMCRGSNSSTKICQYTSVDDYTMGAEIGGYSTTCPVVSAQPNSSCTSNPNLTLNPDKTRVQIGTPVLISWGATGVSGTCRLVGPGYDSGDVSQSECSVRLQLTRPIVINTQSRFTLTCDGQSKSVIVNVVPKFSEF